MNYKRFPFNMTLAKRISDGSVNGRIRVICDDGSDLGFATYKSQSGNNYNFLVEVIDGRAELAFDNVGFYNSGVSRYHLVIEIPVEDSYDEDVTSNSFIEQEKDAHYHKCKIEPIDYILANNLGFCEGNVVKYITRYKDKGGIDDLRKIKVYVDYLIDDLTKDDDA